MDLYAQNILDHYRHPRNKGILKNADFTYREINCICGDNYEVALKMSGQKIEKIKFNGEGCAISLATISILSEKLLGMSKREVLNYSFKNLEKELGIKISESRSKCALLGLEAIQHALEQGKSK